MIVLCMILQIFSTRLTIDSSTLVSVLRPGVVLDLQKRVDSVISAKHSTDTARFVPTRTYRYRIQLLTNQKQMDGNLKVSNNPALSVFGISWLSRALGYGYQVDTSNVLAEWTGLIQAGTTITENRGSTIYAKSSVLSNATGTTTTSYQPYSSGMEVRLGVDSLSDSTIRETVSYTYSIPTSSETPPSLQTSNYNGSFVSTVGDTQDVSGLTYFSTKKSLFLFGFGKSYEQTIIKLRVIIERINDEE